MIQQDPEGLGSPLLRVVNEDTPAEYGADAVEEHLIPLVDAIVPDSNRATRTLYVTPPPGLLQLGRQRMLLAYLHTALLVRSRV